MRYLVTGAGGFIGSYLVDELISTGAEVCASIRKHPTGLAVHDRLIIITGDVLNRDYVARVIGEFKPDCVFHLAAQTLQAPSWEDPEATFALNVTGTLNVLDAIRGMTKPARLIMACSSSEYGWQTDPIPETAPFLPASPYAASKVAADHLVRLYHARYGLPTIRAYPFFWIGPRKTGDVCSDLARGIVDIEQGRRQVLDVGNLSAVRDFLDVRDGVAALRLLAEKGLSGEAYNVCSGRGRSIAEMLNIMKQAAHVPITERVDNQRLRPLDEPIKVGNCDKLSGLGWKPQFPVEKTVEAILDYWRAQY
jgi:GDP-4-dehydro-6-deoxy-D-mannose reductase